MQSELKTILAVQTSLAIRECYFKKEMIAEEVAKEIGVDKKSIINWYYMTHSPKNEIALLKLFALAEMPWPENTKPASCIECRLAARYVIKSKESGELYLSDEEVEGYETIYKRPELHLLPLTFSEIKEFLTPEVCP